MHAVNTNKYAVGRLFGVTVSERLFSAVAPSLQRPLEQFEVFSNQNSVCWSFTFLPRAFYGVAPAFLSILFMGLLVTPKSFSVVPTSWVQRRLELLYRATHSFILENASRSHQGYLFIFVELGSLLALYNLIGLLPYGFTLTAQAIATGFYAAMVFIGLSSIAIQRHGVYFFNLFLPAGTPFFLAPLMVILELISYTARLLRLAIRLFANMMAGHALLAILGAFTYEGLLAGGLSRIASLAGVFVVYAVLAMEFAVAMLQVFVFMTLFSLYLNDTASTAHLFFEVRQSSTPKSALLKKTSSFLILLCFCSFFEIGLLKVSEGKNQANYSRMQTQTNEQQPLCYYAWA